MKLFLYTAFIVLAIKSVVVMGQAAKHVEKSASSTEGRQFMVRRAQKVDAVDSDRSLTCCKNDYTCPKYSRRRPDRSCYNDASDCYCDNGYKMYDGECVPDYTKECANDYQCPQYSWRKDDYDKCYDSIDGCECESGYEMYNGECVPYEQGHCKNDVVCPAYAWRKPGQQCYNTVADDCRCDYGYKMYHGRCVPDSEGCK